MSMELLHALHERFKSDPEVLAAVPGGWYYSEGPVLGGYPFLVVRQMSGGNDTKSSTSNIDAVRIRFHVNAVKYEEAVRCSQAIAAWVDKQPGFIWDGGWATALEQIDEMNATPAGRAPEEKGGIQMVELLYLSYVRRNAHA